MATKDIIRWGIIGCGDVTELKSGPAYQKTDGFRLTAVMRRDAEKVKDYARRHGVPKYYTHADDLINDDEVDAVYIATPPDSHKLYALRVAEAGKPCCIEKPMATCYQDCLEIISAFEKGNIPLFVAYYRRSLPRFNHVKTWLNNHEIGEVRHISWHLIKPPSDTDRSGVYNWRTDPAIAPGGHFDDLASHGIDLFIHFLGNIKDVYGISANQQNLYKANDAVTACWMHENGITGMGTWNFGSDTHEDQVEIFGSKGKIKFSVFHDNSLILEKGKQTIEKHIDHPENIQLYHVQNMAKQLLGEQFRHPSTGQTAAQTSWVMDKILGTIA